MRWNNFNFEFMRIFGIIVLVKVLTLFFLPAFGQEIAITERGDSVVLYYNGTWDYWDNYQNNSKRIAEIGFNENTYTKPASSNKKINGSNQAYEVWYDDKVWKRVPVGNLNDDADMALQMIKGDVYSLLIYEELQVPIENLSDIALENAIGGMPDVKIVDRNYRVVNSDTLICMQMDGSTQGMKITYYTYYFSNSKGSFQFHAFTGQNVFEKYKSDIENLLNGFIAKD